MYEHTYNRYSLGEELRRIHNLRVVSKYGNTYVVNDKDQIAFPMVPGFSDEVVYITSKAVKYAESDDFSEEFLITLYEFSEMAYELKPELITLFNNDKFLTFFRNESTRKLMFQLLGVTKSDTPSESVMVNSFFKADELKGAQNFNEVRADG